MPDTVQICLLGAFAVTRDGAADTTPWRLRKAKTLVKLLALAPGRRIHREVLIDQLWPEVDLTAGANNLHQALHAARAVLGRDQLVLDDEVVVLGPGGALGVDVEVFDDAAANALASGKPEELRGALDLWTGELLPEDLYEDWAAPHRDRLNAVHMRLVATLADALSADGAAEEAVALVAPMAAERPLDEHVHRALMSALAAAGRRWDAAAAFERLRAALDEEYGAEPDAETNALYRRLFVGGAPGGGAPHNLPTMSTSFVGRQRELTELASLLRRTRLLTLTGPGGAGKTRLAVELAHHEVAGPRHPDGVWLVDLAAVADGDAVPSAVAAALRVPMPGDRPWVDALVGQLSTRSLLLVLDNCEHVLDTVVPFTVELLARCPDLVVLATTREAFAVPGEVAWRVPSLELPAGDLDDEPEQLAALESVQLFVERASSASPGFELDGATAPHVAVICRRLDGIPLALELAAARVAHLSVAQLEERLGDALTLLARHGRGHLDRQQTLAATLDWSHDLLGDDERVWFRRLAVFAGGFDLDAASAVLDVADPVDVLGRLVDKSLVVAETLGDVARYRLLEVVRQYAEVKLAQAGERQECRRRHRTWFAAEAARHDPDRGVPVVLEPSPWFDTEQDNLRAAIGSAFEDDPCCALELATSMWRFLMSRGQLAECLDWLTRSLDTCPDLSAVRVRALFAKGVMHVRRADLGPVVTVARDITEVGRRLGNPEIEAHGIDQEAIFTLMAHDPHGAARLSASTVEHGEVTAAVAARAAHFAGVLALTLNDGDAARAHLAEAAAHLERVSDEAAPFFTTLTACWVVDNRGPVALPVGEETMVFGRRVGAAQARGHVAVAAALAERVSGHVDEAVRLLDGAVKWFTDLGDMFGLGYALSQRGHTLRWAAELDAARASFDESEAARRPLRDLRAIAMTLAGRAYVDALLERTDAARAQARESISMMRRTGDEPGVALTVHNAGLVELQAGRVDSALPMLVEALDMAERVTPLHALGWEHLLVAHVRALQGDMPGSVKAVAEAAASFDVLDDRRGRDALQRLCKADGIRMPS